MLILVRWLDHMIERFVLFSLGESISLHSVTVILAFIELSVLCSAHITSQWSLRVSLITSAGHNSGHDFAEDEGNLFHNMRG